MHSFYCAAIVVAVVLGGWCRPTSATELIRITAANYSKIVPAGKEVDAIVGDYVLRNDKVVAVIAQPIANRKANMTVRGVAGMLIDFTTRYHGSDQLSCFYPAAGRYLFEQADGMTCEVDKIVSEQSQPEMLSGKAISISFAGTAVAANGTTAVVTYTLSDDQSWLEYRVRLSNDTQNSVGLTVEDSLRCDGSLFEMDVESDRKIFYAEDRYFGQSYGWMLDEDTIRREGSGRNLLLKSTKHSETQVRPGESFSWNGELACSQGLPGVRSWADAMLNQTQTVAMELTLESPQGAVAHASVDLFPLPAGGHQARQSLGTLVSTSKGEIRCSLLPGSYKGVVNSIGRQPREYEFTIESGKIHADTLSLPAASRVRTTVVDGAGMAIAAKVQFIGIDGTVDPDFGPDSAAEAVKNTVYCALGKFEQPILPGKYRVIVSHGTEYDAETLEINVAPGQLVPINSKLPRTVDTSGWISSDFHSHSSPSGDNVSDQRGRVLNLLAEHIEFAPCTEHNRIDTYEDDLHALRATTAMATCTGMELTGSPLPINHQNAFPMHRHQHEQDGGGPQTEADPVKQIERLALWDNSSPKVVQTNHPNIPQILGDVDLDGKPDGGFRGMLGWMDVIEVHPPEGIFNPPAANIAAKDKNQNPIFFWLQLLNLGYRITGVVNTDAHYNFHGSGWLRNYLASSTDDPAKISLDEIIHASEHGHLVMTTGPFLQTQLRVVGDGAAKVYGVGEDVPLGNADAKIWMRVQCPNWFDVNRVQVFANGRPVDTLNFTRQSHPRLFREGNVRFEFETELPKFSQDTHLIVATIGEGLKLGPVMGADRGELPPVAVTNPIFVDVDGSGFQANGDDLGVPFMLPQLAE